MEAYVAEQKHGDRAISGQLKLELSFCISGRIPAVSSMLDWVKENWVLAATPIILGVTFIYTVTRDVVGTVRWNANRKLDFGKPRHPDLVNPEHSDSVIFFEVVNRSEGKAFVTSVRALDYWDNETRISYSTRIDDCGNQKRAANIVPITDSTEIYVSRKDGEPIDYMRLEVQHSFSNKPVTVVFDISDLMDQ